MMKIDTCEFQHSEGLNIPINAKLASLSASYTGSSKSQMFLMFIIYQFQLLLIISKPIFSNIKETNTSEVFKKFYEAFFWEELPAISELTSTVYLIVGVIDLYLLLNIGIVSYLIATVYRKKDPHTGYKGLWKMLLCLHTNVLFYPIHVFCSKIFYISEQRKELFENEGTNYAVEVMVLFIMVFNIIWSCLIVAFFTINIKTKNTLSTKTNAIKLIDLIFSIIMPIAEAFTTNTDAYVIALLAISVFYCLLRDYIYFHFLPYYKITTLKLAGICHSIITGFALAAIISRPISIARSYSQLSLLIPMWILFIIALKELYTRHLNKLLLTILKQPANVTNPYHVMHYLQIYKYYSKCPNTGVRMTKIKEKSLHYISVIKQSEVAYLLSSEKLNSQDQALIDKHFIKLSLDLLNIAIKRNPKLLLLKATLAHYYTRYEKLYILANQILDTDLRTSLTLKNSFYMIKTIILEKLKDKEYKQDSISKRHSEHNILELQRYLYLQEVYNNLKKDIIKQLKLQTQFWKNFQSVDSDFLSLLNLAKNIFSKSKNVKKTSKAYRIFKEGHFGEPVLVYSLYFYFVQNDLLLGQKFFDEYSKLESRKKQISLLAQEKSLLRDFSKSSLNVIVSASQDQLGKILECRGQFDKVFGRPKQMLIGSQLSTLMPQIYARWFQHFFRTSVSDTESRILNQIIEIPLVMKDGYVVNHLLYLTLNYLEGFGLCYSGLIGCRNDDKRLAIITENGHMSNFSKEFAQDMEIRIENWKSSESIYKLCPQLEEILLNFKDSDKNDILDGNNELLQDVNLDFIALSNEKKAKTFRTLPSLQPTDFISYKAKIQMRRLQEGSIFELLMERSKLNNPSALTLERNCSVPLTQKAKNNDNTKSLFSGENLKTNLTNFQMLETMTAPRERKGIFNPTSFKNEANNRESKYESIEPTLQSSLNVKREKSDITPEKYACTDTGSEAMTPHLLLTSAPMSEIRKLITVAKGDLDDDFDLDSVQKDDVIKIIDESSFSDKEIKGQENQRMIDFKMLGADLLKEVLGKNESDEDLNSVFLSIKAIDAQKAVRKVIESRNYPCSSLAYIFCFALTMVAQMTFLVWLNISISHTSQDVGILSNVIQSASFRNFWHKISINDMLFWVALRGGFFEYDDLVLQGTFTRDYYRLGNFNDNLRDQLSQLDTEIQDAFYTKNIEIYERDSSNNLILVSTDDSFEATQRIVNYGIINGFKPLQFYTGMDFVDWDTKFIIDNALNSFMVVTEKLIADLQTRQFDVLKTYKTSIVDALVAILIVLFLFIVASLKFVSTVNKDFATFVNILFTFPAQEIAKTEYHLSKFNEALENDCQDAEILSAFSLGRPEFRRKLTYMSNQVKNEKSNRKITYKPSMKKFYMNICFSFVGLFTCLSLMTGFMMIYYFQASNKVVVMEKQHISLNSALNVLNTFAYTIPELQLAALMNASITIKNVPVLDYVKDSVSKISRASDFQASLQDENGEISAFQKELLFNHSCTKAYTPLFGWSLDVMQPECEAISNGLNSVGLLKLITTLEPQLEQFVYDFETKPRDIDGLKARLLDALGISNTTDISFILLLKSFEDSTNNFQNLVVELERERVTLAWVAISISIALGVITWMFIVKRLSRKEFERKKVLALMPNKLILGNFLLKKYITNMK